MKFQTFSYHTLDEIRQAANGLSLTLPLSELLSVLRQPVSAGPLRLANRIAIQPMEGCDGTRMDGQIRLPSGAIAALRVAGRG